MKKLLLLVNLINNWLFIYQLTLPTDSPMFLLWYHQSVRTQTFFLAKSFKTTGFLHLWSTISLERSSLLKRIQGSHNSETIIWCYTHFDEIARTQVNALNITTYKNKTCATMHHNENIVTTSFLWILLKKEKSSQ